MEFPKWHDPPNDSTEPVQKQNTLDGKNVIKIDDQEKLIQHMSAQFVDMLRENFSDPNL